MYCKKRVSIGAEFENTDNQPSVPAKPSAPYDPNAPVPGESIYDAMNRTATQKIIDSGAAQTVYVATDPNKSGLLGKATALGSGVVTLVTGKKDPGLDPNGINGWLGKISWTEVFVVAGVVGAALIVTEAAPTIIAYRAARR
jgi:hypothetical protein